MVGGLFVREYLFLCIHWAVADEIWVVILWINLGEVGKRENVSVSTWHLSVAHKCATRDSQDHTDPMRSSPCHPRKAARSSLLSSWGARGNIPSTRAEIPPVYSEITQRQTWHFWHSNKTRVFLHKLHPLLGERVGGGISKRRGAWWTVLQLDGDGGTETNLSSDSEKLNFALTWPKQIADWGFPTPDNEARAASARAEGAPLCLWSHSIFIPTLHLEGVPGKYYLMAKGTHNFTSATHNIYLQNFHILNTKLLGFQEKKYIQWEESCGSKQSPYPRLTILAPWVRILHQTCQNCSPQHSHMPTLFCQIVSGWGGWNASGHFVRSGWDLAAVPSAAGIARLTAQSNPREK